jgi:hypothetical protein
MEGQEQSIMPGQSYYFRIVNDTLDFEKAVEVLIGLCQARDSEIFKLKMEVARLGERLNPRRREGVDDEAS